MSASSYIRASKTHHAEGSTGAGMDAIQDPHEDSGDVLMPTEEFPTRGINDELLPEVGSNDEGHLQEVLSDFAEAPKSSRLFHNGQLRKKPQVARSFSDEFIENKDPITDEEHFIRYQQGDEKGFFTIYERYRHSVYSYCARVLLSAGLAEELVEDTFQEIFLRVSQYRNSFHSGEFRAWIFTVTRNTCLSSKKRGLKNLYSSATSIDPDTLSENDALEGATSLERSDNPLEMLSMKEQTDYLLKAIAELPETYREALMMSEYEGLTYEEIGKLTGTSLSTIRIRVFRAKKRLRKVLQPILGDEYVTGPSNPVDKEEENDV